MMLVVLLIASSLNLSASSLNQSASGENLALPNSKQKTVLVVGDSISAAFGLDKANGWVEIIANRFPENVQMVNASISGDTTTGGRYRLAKALSDHQPDLVIIELGGNDGLRGTPIPLVKSNLEAMITASQKARAHVLLLGMKIPPNYGERYTQMFESMYHELAREYEIMFIPFFLEGVAGLPDMMQKDGIHPTEKAQPLMADWVAPKLEQWLSTFQ